MIVSLHDDCDLWIPKHTQIASKITEDFSKRFRSSDNEQRTLGPLGLPNRISNIENNELIILLNLVKVHTALFSIKSSKTPGPDGFSVGFFKNYWSIIKNDLFNCIAEFFTNGKMLKELNHTFIALIPKNENLVQTNQFRPIRLLPKYSSIDYTHYLIKLYHRSKHIYSRQIHT